MIVNTNINKAISQNLTDILNTIDDTQKINNIPQLFAQQAKIFPYNIAVVCGEEAISYIELHIRSEQLAEKIKQHYRVKFQQDMPIENIIGLAMERNIEMIIAILAILKTGGAYVPLDPDYPVARIEFIVNDANLRILLTTKDVLNKRQDLHNILQQQQLDIIYVNNLNHQPSNELYHSINNLPNIYPIKPHNLAYVIYTSGSTGNPKGVLVEHRNVMRLFTSCQQFMQFSSEDVWTMFHSFAFDFSVWEIWGSLLHGGKLIVVPYLISRSPEDFYQLLLQEQVTILSQTPSAFTQLMQVAFESQIGKKNHLTHLKYMIFGGEALNLHILKPWIAQYGFAKPSLINMYGITETTVHVTYLQLNAEIFSALENANVKDDNLESNHVKQEEAQDDCITNYSIKHHSRPNNSLNNQSPNKTALLKLRSPIGCCLHDLYAYVLNDQGNEVDEGEIGELYIGGLGVARGYWQRETLTNERFIVDNLRNSQQKIYKTGDLVKKLSHGNFDYIGRCDNQVQFRGFRIELGEIEAVLATYPNITQVVIMMLEVYSNPSLVAYYVSNQHNISNHQTQPINPQYLRMFLQKKLPKYMIPTYFIQVNAMYLTVNGKIDKQQFPTPEQYLQTNNHFQQKNRTETLHQANNYIASNHELTPDILHKKLNKQQQKTAKTEQITTCKTSNLTEIETILKQIWQEVLHLSTIDIHDNFFMLGGDSISCMQIVARARDYNLYFSSRELLTLGTITELAIQINENNQNQNKNSAISNTKNCNNNQHYGKVPLVPIQKRYFQTPHKNYNTFYQAQIFQLPIHLTLQQCQQIWKILLQRHPVLTARFYYTDNAWHQEIPCLNEDELNVLITQIYSEHLVINSNNVSNKHHNNNANNSNVSLIDFTKINQPDFCLNIRHRLQHQLNIQQGKLIALALLDNKLTIKNTTKQNIESESEYEQTCNQYLLVVVHHLVIDGISWRILAEDFHSLAISMFNQEQNNNSIQSNITQNISVTQSNNVMPNKIHQTVADNLHINSTTNRNTYAKTDFNVKPKTTSSSMLSCAEAFYAYLPQAQHEWNYWLNLGKNVSEFYVDNKLAKSAINADIKHLFIDLSTSKTHALLNTIAEKYHTQINDILLSALMLAVYNWSQTRDFLFQLEGHGREEECLNEVDFTHTIGWFTSFFPVHLTLPENWNMASTDYGLVIKHIKELLRNIPHKGFGYAVLRFLSKQNTGNQQQCQYLNELECKCSICFNYLGILEQAIYEEDIKENAINTNAQLMEINSWIANQQLYFDIAYNTQAYEYSTIDKFAQCLQTQLQILIAFCEKQTQCYYTPSDFPLTQVTQQFIDKITQQEQLLENIYPLTTLQNGLLFHNLYNAQNDTTHGEQYCVQLHWFYDKAFHIESFIAGFNILIQHHESLRSAFVWENLINPVQLIYKNIQLNHQILNWQDVATEQEIACKLEDFLQQERKIQFDITQPSLMRLHIIILPNNNSRQYSYVVVWSSHHLILDGWSMPILLKELHEYYACLRDLYVNKKTQIDNCLLLKQLINAKQTQAFSANIAYKKYLNWLHEVAQKPLDIFWLDMAKNLPLDTKFLPHDYNDTSKFNNAKLTNTYNLHNTQIKRQFWQISENLAQQLQHFCSNHKVTLNAILQFVWALVMAYYSKKHCIVFGVVVAGRPEHLSNIDKVTGLFINTLPLCINFNVTQSLNQQLQTTFQQLQTLNNLSFTSLSELQKINLAHKKPNSYFNVIFDFENMPDANSNFILVPESFSQDKTIICNNQQHLSNEVYVWEQTHYPLAINVIHIQQNWQMMFSYVEQIWNTQEITLLIQLYAKTLSWFLQNSQTTITDFLALNLIENPKQLCQQITQQLSTSIPQTCLHNEQLLPQQNDNTEILRQIWQDLLLCNSINLNDDFFSLGGDSIISIQMISKLRQQGLDLALSDLFDYPLFSDLVQKIKPYKSQNPQNNSHKLSKAKQQHNPHNIDCLRSDKQHDLVHKVTTSLTPIQYWFFTQNFVNHHHYNQSILISLQIKLHVTDLAKIVHALLSKYAIFATRWQKNPNTQKWEQFQIADFMSNINIQHLQYSDLYGKDEIFRATQTAINLEQAPIAQFVLLNENELFITIHHLYIDGVSWRILLENFAILCRQFIVKSQSLTTLELEHVNAKNHQNLQQWQAILQAYLPKAFQQLAYWQAICRHALQDDCRKFYVKNDNHQETKKHLKHATIIFSLDATQTFTLQEFAKQQNISLNITILSMLLLALQKWHNINSVVIDLESHGREKNILVSDSTNNFYDVTQTLGWFTTIFPTSFSLNELQQITNNNSLCNVINYVKQTLKNIPDNGIGFGVLKYLQQPQITELHNAKPAVLFNYLGVLDNNQQNSDVYTLENFDVPYSIAEHNSLAYLLEFNSFIKNSQLTFSITYQTTYFSEQEITKLFTCFSAITTN